MTHAVDSDTAESSALHRATTPSMSRLTIEQAARLIKARVRIRDSIAKHQRRPDFERLRRRNLEFRGRLGRGRANR